MDTKNHFHPNRIYLYRSVDGVYRQRCGRHIHRELRYQPSLVVGHWPPGRYTCLECHYTNQEALPPPADDQEPAIA